MKRKEIAIGEVIEVKIKCVDSDPFKINCDSCIFSQSSDNCELFECRDERRSDEKYVHFELLNIE